MSNVLIETGPTIIERRPRFEGSNICTWIGFKHVMYLVEEAVLEHFRRSGLEPRRLYEEQGLCVEIIDSGVRVLHALHMDDMVRIEVTPKTPANSSELIFGVQMFVNRDGSELKSLTGKVKVLLRQDRCGITVTPSVKLKSLTGKVKTLLHQDRSDTTVTPSVNGLSPYVVSEINRANDTKDIRDLKEGRGVNSANDDLVYQVLPSDANAFVWKWHVPYFYCHFNERIQHSGYLRLMEEVVDLFLADRGISIRTMLDTRRWIPVVPNARLEILAEALMEETIYTIYKVENIFKDVTYTSRMDCYVPRNGTLLHTATGTITHGYAEILNRRDWELVNFDEYTLAALKGKNGPTAFPYADVEQVVNA